jgi:hypothetical protein
LSRTQLQRGHETADVVPGGSVQLGQRLRSVDDDPTGRSTITTQQRRREGLAGTEVFHHDNRS